MMCCGLKNLLLPVVLTSVVIVMPCLISCAGTSEAAREEHEYMDATFRQKFIEDRERCHSRGRTIIISGDGAGMDRDGIPRGRVNYYCARVKAY